MYLLEQAKQRGVREMRGEVIAVEVGGRGVQAVQVAQATGIECIETRCFVNAAGPFLVDVAAMLDISLPIHNVLHQKVVLRDDAAVVPRDAPFLIYLDEQYLDWSEEERELLASDPNDQWLLEKFPGGLHVRPEGGPDSPWIKLGWAFNSLPSAPTEAPVLPADFPHIVLRGATRFVSGLKQYVDHLSKTFLYDGGFYTRTRENLPLIGTMGRNGAYTNHAKRSHIAG